MPFLFLRERKHVIPLVVSVLVALLVGGTVAYSILFSPSTARTAIAAPVIASTTVAVPYDGASGTLPATLTIPRLSIVAHIQHVGRTVSGLMASPSNFTDVAWFREGTVPGEEGSAVIAGHLDNALALDGVFKHLTDLKVGDEVDVQTLAGDTLRFRVTDSEVYPYTNTPGDLFTKKGGDYLTLITCAGTWLPGAHTYDHRLVVTTVLVNS